MRDNIFTVFARDHNPLSYLLRQDARGLAERAAYAPTLEHLDAFVDEAMTETIAPFRRVPPTLGQLLPGRIGEGKAREEGPSHRIPTTRLVYEIEVLGDEELLTRWPDENDDALRPVNQDLMDEIGDENTASDEDMHRYFDSITWWTSRTVRAPNGNPMVVLTTWADLTPDELAQPARRKEISDLFIQRRTDAESILAAVATQVAKFYDVDLPEMLRQRAAARRTHLDNVNMTFRTIGLPTEWKVATPKAVEVPDPPVVTVEGLSVPIRWRLEPASYEDIQRTIRAWADRVEDHSQAFSGLIEDRVSDLLCATLHATTSGAGREIFSRGGKTDIRIQASALDEGNGPASIFVLESKWVEGREDVESAIEDQLMRYVPVAAISTVFLALSRNADFPKAVDSIRSWARGVTGYLSEGPGAVDEWPIFTYEIAELGNLQMQVCIATVALPKVPSTRAEKKAAAEEIGDAGQAPDAPTA